jgi:hypothetical protein
VQMTVSPRANDEPHPSPMHGSGPEPSPTHQKHASMLSPTAREQKQGGSNVALRVKPVKPLASYATNPIAKELYALQNETVCNEKGRPGHPAPDEGRTQKRSCTLGAIGRKAATDAFTEWAVAACKAGDTVALACIRGSGFGTKHMFSCVRTLKLTQNLAHLACTLPGKPPASTSNHHQVFAPPREGQVLCLKMLKEVGCETLFGEPTAHAKQLLAERISPLARSKGQFSIGDSRVCVCCVCCRDRDGG